MTPKTVQCDTHGERAETFVCRHLIGDDVVGRGFNRNEPTEDNPFPDAWCDDCELIRATHDGWNEESEKLTQISLLCSGCYNRARIRNTRTGVSLDDLKEMRWKCGHCEEWHTGAPLDFGYDTPGYWTPKDQKRARFLERLPVWLIKPWATFLDDNYCAIGGKHFFVRGLIRLSIIGTDQYLVWGVWGSLSKVNFHKLLEMHHDPKRVELPPMFSWLSNNISEYPDTLNLKMYTHVQEPGLRPHFELEHTDHRLAQEYHHGITPERVKEIIRGRMRNGE